MSTVLPHEVRALKPRELAGLTRAVQRLARAYYLHHASCATCIAAGRGPRYDTRCDAGQELWTAYDQASAGGVREVDAEAAEGLPA